jgi:hypothetical protein
VLGCYFIWNANTNRRFSSHCFIFVIQQAFMSAKATHKTVFLFTPPFTQLNTPYPATCYLKGFLNTKGISCYQADLGIETILAIFCKTGLQQVFARANQAAIAQNPNLRRIDALREKYIQTIDAVVLFLQGQNPTLANLVAQRSFLPEASRFAQLDYLTDAFGQMGLQDQAKHLATLYLEDLSDFIKATVDEHFGFSRYAEQLGRSANQFDELYAALQTPLSFVDELMLELLAAKMDMVQPKLVGISVPFPGNLFSALRAGQWIKQHYPQTKIALGGGFANTELRSLSDERVFEFWDFVSLDDGEMPLELLLDFIAGNKSVAELKRTFTMANKAVTYVNNNTCQDYPQHQLGTPDYSDLPLHQYIDAIEVVNPMHKLWSDGRWNKLTMAHGCYWGKCTFCDVSLPYIKDYEPIAAGLLVDRMETMIRQTGNNGFHFVDEAAPPALMRSLALTIIERQLVVSWWTNVRFEKSFTQDLCYLLAASGCIAVSGGLEVASDRLLGLIDKGITVKQVAQVTNHFTQAGIMVHAYLMYGFPTQTVQETIDSLEMVRQLFQGGYLQSGFWHRFAMTAHSPVGLNPEKYKVIAKRAVVIGFADNDVEHEDPEGADHDQFGFGLKKSLLNYMHGTHFDKPLQHWFEQKMPKTTVAPTHIQQCIKQQDFQAPKPNAKIVWLGADPMLLPGLQQKKNQELVSIEFYGQKNNMTIQLAKAEADWFLQQLPLLKPGKLPVLSYGDLAKSFAAAGFSDFDLFWCNKPINKLNAVGLLMV